MAGWDRGEEKLRKEEEKERRLAEEETKKAGELPEAGKFSETRKDSDTEEFFEAGDFRENRPAPEYSGTGAAPGPAESDGSVRGMAPGPAESDGSVRGMAPGSAVSDGSVRGAVPWPVESNDSVHGAAPRPAVSDGSVRGAAPGPAGSDGSAHDTAPGPAVSEPAPPEWSGEWSLPPAETSGGVDLPAGSSDSAVTPSSETSPSAAEDRRGRREKRGERKDRKNRGKKGTRFSRLTVRQKIFRILIPILVLLLLAAAVIFLLRRRSMAAATAAAAVSHQTAVVQRQDIVSSLSSSGTLQPKNAYDITSLASGEVISADFEEGDQVEKGQVLYVIDATSLESDIRSAENSVERAQSSYDLAVEDYNEAVSDYSGNTYKATETGYIKTLHVKEGDKVSNNTVLADIYDDHIMKLRLPFLNTDAAGIGVGNEGLITLSDTGEVIGGIVTAVSNMDETLAGGRIVRYVTLQVTNPGGLTTSHSATAQIGNFLSAQEGTFEPVLDTVMTADLSGVSGNTSVEIETLLFHEGDYITSGSALFRMTDKSARNILRSFEDSMNSAQENLETAQNRLDTAQDSYENYTITAPVSGRVITKNIKAGDKITSGGNSSVVLATIYDLSQLVFEMSVDELDVQSVKTGQRVEIQADAFAGETFTGKVTNVSLVSSYSNGVTNYPVTVVLDETGDLLPGMNVDGTIILEEAQNALVIPVDSLMRGNQVYVKDPTATAGSGSAPEGFRAVQVETGLINSDYVEITSGLSEGDEVYVSASSVSGNSFMMPGGMGGGMPGGNMGGGMPGGGGNMGGGSGRGGNTGGGRR